MELNEITQEAILGWLAGELARLSNGQVQRVDTHAAVVLLAGDHAYKVKRAVRYPYLDFSTLAARKSALDRELTLNRRSAPSLYRRVFSINREDGGALLPLESQAGSPIEWVLEMERFDRNQELDRLVERGALELDLIDKLATSIAGFHETCEPRSDMGGFEEMARLIAVNTDQLKAMATFLSAGRIQKLEQSSMATLEKHRALLEARRARGFVRHCHGDLHLGNIVCIEGMPTLFDCIEFDERLACIDTLYDLAFLLMDLIRCERGLHANRLLNGYIDAIPYADYAATLDGLALLPLFLSMRAAIRAHVSVTRVRSGAEGTAKSSALAYMKLAEEALAPTRPRLIAIGGLSGSGKSTFARKLAPHLGLPLGSAILRTDVLRKRMMKVPLTARLDETAYTPEASNAVYAEMMTHALRVLQSGHPVILDAVFARQDERTAARDLAESLAVPFSGIWLTAPYRELSRRLDLRQGDASDATRAVLDRQRTYDLGDLDWSKIETSTGIDDALPRALEVIG